MATAKDNLDRQIGEANANAVEALIDEKLAQRSEDLEGLRQEIVTLREQVGDRGRASLVRDVLHVPELRRQLQAAAGLLRDAIDDHNGLVDRRNAGEPVSEKEVVEDEARIKRVSTDVESVRDELEQRVTALEERADGHDSDIQSLRDADTHLQEQINEIRSGQSEVTTSGGKSGLKAALITFTVVFFVVWLVIVLTPIEGWLWAVVWGAILGGLVGLVVGIASKEGTRTNTFMGDLRETRRARQERKVAEDVEETPAESSRTRVVTKEKVSA